MPAINFTSTSPISRTSSPRRSADIWCAIPTSIEGSQAPESTSGSPDVVWKTNINRGTPEVTRAMENWNDHADIDLPGADGETLIAKYVADESTLNYGAWMSFT